MKTILLLLHLIISFSAIAEIKRNIKEQPGDRKNTNQNLKISKLIEEEINLVDNHLTIDNGVSQPYSYYKHTVNNFDNPTLISEGSLTVQDIFWNNTATKLYGKESEGNNVVLIDPEDGSFVIVSTLFGVLPDQVIQAITIDNNNTCYVASVGLGTSTVANLYTCNIETGELTHIGSQTKALEIVDMTSDCDGNLYAIDGTSRKIFFIDKSTGEATVLSNQSVGNEGFNYLTYDRKNDKLYQYVLVGFAAYNFANINKATGEATFLSNTVGGVYLGDFRNTCDDRNTFQISPGLNGSWFNPETSGQGILIDVFPVSDLFFAAWFTYEDSTINPEITANIGSPEHRWFTAQGELGEGNSVELTIFNVSGGIFNDPMAVGATAVGNMTITFDDCSAGSLHFEFNEGVSGTIPIERIASDNIELCETISSSSK